LRDVWIQGAAMTRFTRHDAGARELVEEAVAAALRDARIDPGHVGAAYVANASAGIMTGQECVRGQVVLRHTGLMGVPIVNVENACASSATALHLGWQAIAGGIHECVVVIGCEKIDHRDRRKRRRAMNATFDLLDAADQFGPDAAGRGTNMYLDSLGTSTRFDSEVMSLLSVKNRFHGSLNEHAHHRETVTVEQVLDSPAVAGRLTSLMCAPLTDGAACLVLASTGRRRGHDGGVRIAASVLVSGRGDDMRRSYSVGIAARQAYDAAAIGPEDLDVVEMFDGTVLAELYLYRELGLCREGDEDRLVRERTVWLGGRLPVNPSGGLIARGHPMGATGAAQLVELTWQLQGRCGARQVPGARLGLAQIVGGWVGTDVAASCVHVLQGPG
jgi:acetyl-CoA acetyltransferase